MQMRQRGIAARCKIHEGVASNFLRDDALRDDVTGRRRLHIKQSVSQCVKPPPPPAWINTASPTGRHEQDYLPSERRPQVTVQKQLEGTQKYINEQCR